MSLRFSHRIGKVMPAFTASFFLLLGSCGSDETPAAASVLPPVIEHADDPPPPIEGGALLPLGNDVVAALDADRGALWLVDFGQEAVRSKVEFGLYSNPFRVVLAGDRLAVTLGGAGEVVWVGGYETGSPSIELRRSVCRAPAGLDYDSTSDSLFVACMDGELVVLNAQDGSEVRRQPLEPDLRDVVITDELVHVSVFREAKIKILSKSDLSVLEEQTPVVAKQATPALAWQMRPHPAGGVYVAHQVGFTGEEFAIDVTMSSRGGYAAKGNCRAAVMSSAISHIEYQEPPSGGRSLGSHVLPVDIAATTVGGRQLALVAAGHRNSSSDTKPSIMVEEESFMLGLTRDQGQVICPSLGIKREDKRQMLAAQFDDSGRLIYQSRDPWEIVRDDGKVIELPGLRRVDTGHILFHQDVGGGIACASCHPGGRDDALTWNFKADVFFGPRRTPAILGGITDTEPFHWSGDVETFEALMEDVFALRMGGPDLGKNYAAALGFWIDTVPSLPGVVGDPMAVERGRTLFHSAEVGCATCHSGSDYTDNTDRDVGTGEVFQVPRLNSLLLRAPYMHDGCAKTLEERITNVECGGGDQHGKTSHLTESEIADLVSFLKTL